MIMTFYFNLGNVCLFLKTNSKRCGGHAPFNSAVALPKRKIIYFLSLMLHEIRIACLLQLFASWVKCAELNIVLIIFQFTYQRSQQTTSCKCDPEIPVIFCQEMSARTDLFADLLGIGKPIRESDRDANILSRHSVLNISVSWLITNEH